jgi:hypothetical protein
MVAARVDRIDSVHDAVVRASTTSYQAVGQEVIANDATPNGRAEFVPDLLLPGLRRVEKIETEASFDSLDRAVVASYRRPGMELWLLVPLSRVADAHQRFRHDIDRLQPWWLQGESVKFGAPREP